MTWAWPEEALRPLAGRDVRLEPLAREHLPGLQAACTDGRLWELFFTSVPEPDRMGDRVDAFLAERDAGTMLPFTVCTPAGDVVGMTTLCHVDQPNRHGEIGYTWYAASHQGSGINVQAKRLLLGLAFDTLGYIAVELRTHWLNHRSRAAIERLGAKQDGVLRNHGIARDGTLRDTVVYSVIEGEWPAVRAHLDRRIAAAR